MYRVLGIRLASARKRAGLTQDQVAARLGYSQDVVSDIETGDRRTDVFELLEFAELYDVLLVQLIAPPTPDEQAAASTPRDRE